MGQTVTEKILAAHLVEGELARARVAAEIVDAVVALFRTEIALLQTTGAATAHTLFHRVIADSTREA